ncbi:MAG TPA: nuclear transport factor 2 family protein [Candidatus Eisenbacteria bacterium]|nr:nuclear transport factor 2 family protein [Candidatus Eisenbacteria bacterium]
MRTLLGLAALLATLASCSATSDLDAASQAANAKAAIDTLWIHYAEAADRRDPILFESIFTEDASVVYSNAPTVSGRQAVQEFLASLYASVDVTNFRVVPEDMKVVGGLAAQSGTFQEEFTEEGAPKVEVGRYTLLAERVSDKSWRIHRLVAIADSTTPHAP